MDKCTNCAGEGLLSQGESIKFTCSVCMGTGKSAESVESAPVVEVESAPVAEESFLAGSGEAGEVSSEVVSEESPT